MGAALSDRLTDDVESAVKAFDPFTPTYKRLSGSGT
jgi:hypothetical protein